MLSWTTIRERYRSSRALRVAVDLAVIVAVLFAVELFQTRAHPRGAAPAAELTALDGSSVPLATFAGKPTLIAVWAPWCGVCKLTAPNVARVRRWLGADVHVISVAAAYDSVAEVQAYAEKHALDSPVLLAGSDFVRGFQVHAFPTFFVLDADGRVVSSMQGYTTTLGLWLRLRTLVF